MLALFLLLAVQAAEGVPTPMTVNGNVLGTPDEFAIAGPGRVCMGIIGIELEQGETAYLVYSGIHAVELRVLGPRGRLDLREADNSRRLRGRRSVVRDAGGLRIIRYPGATVRYGIGGRTEFSGGRVQSLGSMEGSALSGGSADAAVLANIIRTDAPGLSCARRFNYGWGVLMGDESLVESPPQ